VDNGIYRCDSSSAVGDVSTTIELVIQGRLEKCLGSTLDFSKIYMKLRVELENWPL
jgi:hypothetical protein